MNLESQVCSLELAKRLKELGIKQDSLFVWRKWNPPKGSSYFTPEWKISLYKSSCDYEVILAYTASEVIDWLPSEIGNCDLDIVKFNDGRYSIEYICSDHHTVDNTLANTATKMFIHLIEKGLVKIK